MKKIFPILLMISMFFFVSCVSDDEDIDDSADTGNSSSDNSSDNNDPTDSTDTANNNDPTDTGDTGYQPPDNGDTGSGNDPADTGDTGNNNDPADTGDSAPQVECTGLSLDWNALELDFDESGSIFYTIPIERGNKELEDKFAIQFYDEKNSPTVGKKGTYNLSGTNFKDCSQCVLLLEDQISSQQWTKEFFQTSGTLTIEENDDNGNIKGSLKATLVQVTIDWAGRTYESTPVPDGECLEIETAKFNMIASADPDEHKCTEIREIQLWVDSDLDITFEHHDADDNREAYDSFKADYSPYTGSDTSKKNDTFALEILNMELAENNGLEGSHTLSGTNYNDTDIALMVYEDEGEESAKFYFQKKGTVEITKYVHSTHEIEAKLTDVVLQEVSIDPETLESTVVSGKCYKVRNTTITR